MSEHFVREELVRYLTSDKGLLRRIKIVKYHFNLPPQAVTNLLEILSIRYQQRKGLRYLRGTELAPEMPKVYLPKPQCFEKGKY